MPRWRPLDNAVRPRVEASNGNASPDSVGGWSDGEPDLNRRELIALAGISLPRDRHRYRNVSVLGGTYRTPSSSGSNSRRCTNSSVSSSSGRQSARPIRDISEDRSVHRELYSALRTSSTLVPGGSARGAGSSGDKVDLRASLSGQAALTPVSCLEGVMRVSRLGLVLAVVVGGGTVIEALSGGDSTGAPIPLTVIVGSFFWSYITGWVVSWIVVGWWRRQRSPF